VNGNPLHASASHPDFSGFNWIEPPRGRFWADPFAFEHEGQCWAFFEDYSYKEKRAGIACAPVSTEGRLGSPQVCLENAEHHYSYPHIFRAGSEIFMVPESVDSNEVSLFRCRQFPDQWIKDAILLEGKFVDTTIWEHEGLWWLMTTSADLSSRGGALLLFYADSPRGKWQFHPANPISTDIRNNRGAGCVFSHDNRLIRPSQSGAPAYGYSISFNQITALSQQHYEERPMRTITPEHWPGISGIHTYNRAGKVELIDGRSSVALKKVQI